MGLAERRLFPAVQGLLEVFQAIDDRDESSRPGLSRFHRESDAVPTIVREDLRESLFDRQIVIREDPGHVLKDCRRIPWAAGEICIVATSGCETPELNCGAPLADFEGLGRHQHGRRHGAFSRGGCHSRRNDTLSSAAHPLATVAAGFRFHDPRHSAASFLVQAGVPLNTVRQVLGHKSLSMTLRYAHLAPDHLQEAAAVMDSLTAKKPREQAPAGTGA